MLIVKPHGRSITVKSADPVEPKASRKIRLRPSSVKEATTDQDMHVLADQTAFVVAQWVSVIDKIIRKPNGKNKATQNQKQLRSLLGDAALTRLQQAHVVVDADYWNRRIHPYETEEQVKLAVKSINLQGRWYADFLGKDLAPENLQHEHAAQVAEKIFQHLNVAEQRKGQTTPKRKGRIAGQLHAIASNVHRVPVSSYERQDSQDKNDWDRYFSHGDVVAEIYKEANTQPPIKPHGFAKRKDKPVARDLPGKKLYAHYAKVFKADDGSALPVASILIEDVDSKPHALRGQLDLHLSIKACYKALLDRNLGITADKLPKDSKALEILLNQRHRNRDVASLVRLGKVIHYEALKSGNVVTHWPAKADVERSGYWLSEGQSEIKRNEALVRIWKLVIAHAAHSLSDWADGQHDKDIFLTKWCDGCGGIKAKGQNACAADCMLIDSASFDQKFRLLFGREDQALPTNFTDTKTRLQLLRFAVESWAQLRHSSFHFKGRKSFLSALKESTDGIQNTPLFVDALWRTDLCAQKERIKQSLKAAHCEKYLTQQQLLQLFDAIQRPELDKEPMPRLSRVLTRAKHAWKNDSSLTLPNPATKKSLEGSETLLCQYTVTKLLYERSFPKWLSQRGDKEVSKWIKKACDRATQEAQKINKDQFAQARANVFQNFERLNGVASLSVFFDMLAAETVREFRVQRGYGHDAQAAREQSAFIENLKCDVVAQALSVFLNAHERDWVCALHNASVQAAHADISALQPIEAVEQDVAEDWQKRLYFLLHLVPVGEVSGLLHQLRKWNVLQTSAGQNTQDDGRDLYKHCAFVMTLYLDMHDAKFDGGNALQVDDQYRACFEVASDFDDLYRQGYRDEYQQLRGLRELLRFGDLKVLRPSFEANRVTHQAVERLRFLESVRPGNKMSDIVQAQDKLQELHDQWVDSKKNFMQSKEYQDFLCTVVEHRHLAAQVRFNNHLRLHRLMMAVLSRLVDFASLWERDLYFVLLGLIYQSGNPIKTAFVENGLDDTLENLTDGRIVKVLMNLNDEIKHPLRACFNQGDQTKKIDAEIRNALAHFNMLRTDNVNLTEWVNKTRILVQYDRKLKNAVSQSVKELLEREGLMLEWTMRDHQLTNPTMKSKSIEHLNNKSITEQLHGDAYVAMALTLFGRA